MQKKYLVFISSDRNELRAECRELSRVVTELGAIPVAMSEFDISQEDDCRIIRKSIEECDYFLSLAAHRGGKAVGKTFALDLEYSFAIKAGIPVLALIIGDKARRKGAKKGKDAAAQETFNAEAFKKKLKTHSNETWTTLADLRLKAYELVSREITLNPRRGWIPCDEAFTPLVANELSRLSRENELLRGRLALGETGITKTVREQVRNTIKVLAANHISLSFFYTDGENWENTRDFRYLRLFRLLAPELSTPKTTMEISHFLGNIINPDLERIVRKDYPAPSNTVKKIMSDFALLKLVKCAAKPASSDPVNDEDWELTELGKETFATYRLRQMSKKSRQSPE